MMNRLRVSVLCLLAAVACLTASCGGGSDAPTAPSSPSSSQSVPFTVTDLRVGTGAEAVAGKVLFVNYTGWLYSATAVDNKGTQFDTSVGRTPLSFRLGAGSVIPGFDRAFGGMRVGGQRRLIIPPDLAYGSAGAGGVIPPNATLVFDVELVDVQ